MKKYIYFALIFIASYFILQWGTGIILTFLYTPSDPWESSMMAASELEIVRTIEWFPILLYGAVAFVIAYGGMKFLGKRSNKEG